MEALVKELGLFGLSEKESSVYLASLELGPAPVQDISHKAKVNRATTYVMIESLMGRGLMSSFVRGKKRFYASESPERLRSVLRLQRRELEQKEEELEKIYPKLSGLYNAEGAKPQIRYLEGTEGVKTVREMIQKLDGEMIQFSPFEPEQVAVELSEGGDEHVRTILSQGIPYRALLVMNEMNLENVPAFPNVEVRLLPREAFPTDSEIVVRGNTICMYSLKTAVLAVVITSQELANGLRSLFNIAWKAAEAYPSRKS